MNSSLSPRVWGLCILAQATAAPPPSCFLGGLKGPPGRIDFSINVRFGHGNSGGVRRRGPGRSAHAVPPALFFLSHSPLPSRSPSSPWECSRPSPVGPPDRTALSGVGLGGSVATGKGSVLTSARLVTLGHVGTEPVQEEKHEFCRVGCRRLIGPIGEFVITVKPVAHAMLTLGKPALSFIQTYDGSHGSDRPGGSDWTAASCVRNGRCPWSGTVQEGPAPPHSGRVGEPGRSGGGLGACSVCGRDSGTELPLNLLTRSEGFSS